MKEIKDHRFNVRLNDQEMAALELIANYEYTGRSEAFRRILREALQTRKLPRVGEIPTTSPPE